MIQPQYLTLQGLFAERVFRVPHYQRFYCWQRKQLDDLFQDIEALCAGKDDAHHFMATVVCLKTGEFKSLGSKEYIIYDVVDGQQRLTTLILMLKAIHKALPEDEDRQELGRTLVKSDGQLLLLQTNNANAQVFASYLREGKHPLEDQVKTHADQRMADAITSVEDFVTRFQKKWDITKLLRLVRQRLGFVIYDTEDQVTVYRLFEVLNGRGLAVDWLDKAKSIIMGCAFETAENTAVQQTVTVELNNLWGNIYGELGKFNISGQEVLRVTATIHFGSESGKPMSAESAIGRFRSECVSPTASVEVSAKLLEVARKLVELHQDRSLGPVTSVLHARLLAVALKLTDTLSENERSKALDQWERVTFRVYGLCGKDSRTKVGEYVRLANAIMSKAEHAGCAGTIMDALKDLGHDYPIDMAVKQGLDHTNCYEDNQEVCRYVLWNYEDHLAEEAGPNAEVNEEARQIIWQKRSASESIEHVLPQNPEAGGAWDGKIPQSDGFTEQVNRIGNLILLPMKINQEAKRQGFTAKKPIYAKAKLRMVDEVISLKDWSEDQIVAREKRIVEWAKLAWADV